MTDRHPPRQQDCDTCNMHGPELPTSTSALLDLHRAIHDAMQAITQPFINLFERHARCRTEPKHNPKNM